MDAVIIHNSSAGNGDVNPDVLRDAVTSLGYTASYQTADDDAWRQDARRADLVVVAGGDGTVAKVFIEMTNTLTSIAVLPFGTANNIARTLGIPTDNPWAQLQSLDTQSLWFDVPVVQVAGHPRAFVESVGGGLFADLLANKDDVADSEGNDGGRQRLRRLIERATAVPWTIDIDGHEVSGDFIAVETMNIKETGPNIALAPSADPSDGQLELVLLTIDDRPSLLRMINRRPGSCTASPCHFRTVRGRTIRIEPSQNINWRIDDELLPASDTNCVNVTVGAPGSGVHLLLRRGSKLVAGGADRGGR